MTVKYVYSFGEGRADGSGAMKDLLGGKGAGLAEMTGAGLPVPPGFTVTTEVCAVYEETVFSALKSKTKSKRLSAIWKIRAASGSA